MPFAELSGLVAALCWTISSLMAPGLIQRFGTMRFNTIRIMIASSVLLFICLLTQRFNASLWQHAELIMLAYGLFYRHKQPASAIPFSQLTRRDFIGIGALATIGMVIGMSVLVWGVGNANVGIVTTLSAVVPVLILPGLWITTGQRPAFGAWLGAILVVSGAALIILH
ncbi:DMT family transporter [Marinomonas profundimaris]|uniref:EamA domain-containing protein n=1 Tax=Marinomonas profundimaris TaxID=1208321 RepID=W1RNC2_9GAMM|nr:DMT family transporter [Marinomonas profundimaris]ETI57777.1 hypothetical protein D104_18100 [Marinomonas profundimaris]